MRTSIVKLKKENFIRIAPGQFFDLMEYCMHFKKNVQETPAIYHNTNMIIMADLYDTMNRKAEKWQYYPRATYRVFKLKYVEYFVLADELMAYCPTHALNDLLDRLDYMFLNYYDFSLKARQNVD